MRNSATGIFVAALLICLIPAVASAQLSSYSQNFEGLVQTDPGALAADGWLVFGNVFDPGGGYIGGYGPFTAPNSGPPYAFCTIAAGEGGAEQQAQQLVVFSDYNNGEHGNGNLVESNVFQEQIVGGGNVGQTWYFVFQAKLGDIGGNSTALAFIKTLDPNNSYAMTNFITIDMTSIPATWGSYMLSIAIDPALAGQVLQFGFLNVATNYEPSGIFYDNVSFSLDPTVSTEYTSFGNVKSRYR